MIHTGITPFDYWTLSHFSFWLVVGSTLAGSKVTRVRATIGCLLVAVLWEFFERYAEVRWPQVWQSPESAGNIVADVACVSAAVPSFYGYDRWRPK